MLKFPAFGNTRNVSGNFMRTTLMTLLLLNLATVTIAQIPSFDTTYKINKQTLRISTKVLDSNFVLLNSKYASRIALHDTIDGVGLGNIEFPDFDNDGYPDILLTYFGNNPTYYLYLFDPIGKLYKNISNYMSFPDAVQLKSNPKYFYSYHRAGCADMNWVSDLFRIVDFKIVQIGHMDGQGCDFKKELIQIFKVINDKEKGQLIAKLPYIKTLKNFDNKWEFIEKYWNQNVRKFE